MTLAIADYRTALGNLLATAVDSATWTTAILDEALRHALNAYNRNIVYETSFTVAATGYSQDLTGITALLDIIALAYPWSDGLTFEKLTIHWRYTDHHKVHLAPNRPAAGEVIRIRHTKAHTIDDLDAATATTVPDLHRDILTKAAAAYACLLRARQVTENPAIPRTAVMELERLSKRYEADFFDALQPLRPAQNPYWSTYGLD